MSRLADQLKQAVAAFAGLKNRPALIGGLALAAHDVVRATQDVDFLVDADDAGKIHDVLIGLGYQCVHRSQDAANYVRGDEGLDLLYAHRPTARGLLDHAATRDTAMGPLRVVSAEGLIGFKLQALINAPERGRDRQDILDLLRAGRGRLDMQEIRRYFACSTARNGSMDSSKKSIKRPEPERFPLSGPAVAMRQPRVGKRDLADWVDLMEVVEALCPTWPPRSAIAKDGAVYKL